ncbi:DUF4328 domain-containing protein [Kitasatospora sp. NPDC057692]|uniref:DUF4328 domain-containing protein n=1 Tax=Kitasatospora sp. NPDC057692 TaxID=3346215 RepID=UPI003679B785
MTALRPPNGLAAALYVLLGLNAVMAAVVVAADVWADVLLGGLLEGSDDVGFDDLDSVISVTDAMNGLAIPLFLATAVVFVIWFHRIRRNADLLLPNGHRHGSGWAVGAWFTPVVGLWFPWQLTVDCWRASAPLDAEGRRRTPSERVVALWWATWIGSLLIGRIASSMTRQFDPTFGDLESLQSAGRVETVGFALRLVAAVAAIVLVNRLTAMQQERRADINPIAARAAHEARVQL